MQRKSSYRFVILAAVCLVGFLCTYGQYQFSPLADQVMAKYGLTEMTYSMVFTAPMTPALILSLIYGIIIDRVSGKKLGTVVLALAALGFWGRFFCGSFAVLYPSMLLVGFAASFTNSAHPSIFNGWFDAKEAGICIGVYTAMSSLSMAVGSATTALLPSMEFAFGLSAVLLSALWMFWVFFFKDPKEVKAVGDSVQRESVGATLKTVIGNRNIILGALCLMMAFGMIVTVGSFMPMILQENGMTAVQAGAVAAMVPIGQVAGNLVVPIIVNRVGRIRRVLSVLSLCAVVMLVAASACVDSSGLMSAILFVVGFCAGGQVPLIMSFGLRLGKLGAERMGTIGGVLATFQLFGAVVLPSYVVTPIAGDSHGRILPIIAVFCVIGVILPFFLSADLESSQCD